MKAMVWVAGCLVALAPVDFCQDKPTRLTFDVASIRPTKPGTVAGMIKAIPGGHGYTAQNVPVKLMISLMYKVPMRQIEGGPDWLNTERFDIEARADGTYSLDDLHTMFQNLLADRFNLKFHKENREGNVYALTVDPAGLKMKSNDSAENFNIPLIPRDQTTFVGTRVPMPYLSWWLGQQVQRDERPVIDKTGLSGYWDFTLSFLPPLPPDISRDDLPPEVRDKPSIFDAVRDQLGLKLEAQRGPVEHFVVDHVERPSEN